MALVLRKKFDWQEDIDNFDFTAWCKANRGLSKTFRVEHKLSWKGKLRKFFGVKKK